MAGTRRADKYLVRRNTLLQQSRYHCGHGLGGAAQASSSVHPKVGQHLKTYQQQQDLRVPASSCDVLHNDGTSDECQRGTRPELEPCQLLRFLSVARTGC